MDNVAEIQLDGKVYALPVFEGAAKEKSIDISKLRDDTGYITVGNGCGNTGSCKSAITFIDGEQGIPLEMFTVIFAIGRMPGWIANYREVSSDPGGRIYRPRQVYAGPTLSSYIPIQDRN